MTDTLEIRPHFPANAEGRIEYGVFHPGHGAFIASYKDELSAYRYACGYLNEIISLDHADHCQELDAVRGKLATALEMVRKNCP